MAGLHLSPGSRASVVSATKYRCAGGASGAIRARIGFPDAPTSYREGFSLFDDLESLVKSAVEIDQRNLYTLKMGKFPGAGANPVLASIHPSREGEFVERS